MPLLNRRTKSNKMVMTTLKNLKQDQLHMANTQIQGVDYMEIHAFMAKLALIMVLLALVTQYVI